MKRCTIKLLLLLVVCSLCLGTLAGCSGKHGKTLLSLEDTTLSVNIYQLLLTRMKGTLAKHQYQVDSDAFWATVVDKNGSTYNDYFRLTILENAKTYVVGAYLFDHVYGLTLSDDAIAAIDAELAEFVEYDGDGSKTAFNQVLAAYGVNYDILRDAYIVEAKIAALKQHLYGADASQIAPAVQEEYYQEHYVRFKQIFLASYYYEVEKDENGDDIYFTQNSLGNQIICYDTENGTTKTDAFGNVIKDKYGYEVYYKADGKIAYDQENGTTAYVFDKEGQPIVIDYSKEELARIEKEAKQAKEKIPDGEFAAFELLMESRGEDEDAQAYENGYFLYNDPDNYANYPYLEDIVKELDKMEVGQTAIVTSEYGYHVIMKYPLPEGAYADKANSDWFDGFEEGLIDTMFMTLCQPYMDKVEVDSDVLATVPHMKELGTNFYY